MSTRFIMVHAICVAVSAFFIGFFASPHMCGGCGRDFPRIHIRTVGGARLCGECEVRSRMETKLPELDGGQH